jgi:hypothetical protein
MGVLNAAEIGAQALILAGNLTTTEQPDTRTIVCMNWALDHIASPRVYRHRELQTTSTQTITGGTELYNTKGGSTPETLAVDSVVLYDTNSVGNRHRLIKMRDRDAFEESGVVTSGGLPQFYALWGATQLELLPEPSTAYTGWTLLVRRIQKPTYFTLNVAALRTTETTPFGREWDEAVCLATAWRILRSRWELVRAAEMRAELGLLINETAERLNVEAEDNDYGPPVVVSEAMP